MSLQHGFKKELRNRLVNVRVWSVVLYVSRDVKIEKSIEAPEAL